MIEKFRTPENAAELAHVLALCCLNHFPGVELQQQGCNVFSLKLEEGEVFVTIESAEQHALRVSREDRLEEIENQEIADEFNKRQEESPGGPDPDRN